MSKRICLFVFAATFGVGAAHSAEIDDAVAAIRSVKGEGANNDVVATRWREIVSQGVKALPAVLAGFDGADAVAVNWLRSAVETIVDNELKAGRALPVDLLVAFVQDLKRGPRGREMALDLALQTDPTLRTTLVPKLQDDPASGVRREAISFVYDQLNKKFPKKTEPDSVAAYKSLLRKSRDMDQVEKIAKVLKDAGEMPDLVSHLGLITRWQVAGPFDNAKLKGFSAPMPAKIEWRDYATSHDRGLVDLYHALGKEKGLNKETKKKDPVYALARTEVECETERPVEIRAGSPNAIRIFLNGKEVFARDAYHHGERIDQHIGHGVLKAGKNEIMLKVCQDDRPMNWTFSWHFALRVCDDIGGAVPMKILTAPSAQPTKPVEPKKEPNP